MGIFAVFIIKKIKIFTNKQTIIQINTYFCKYKKQQINQKI